jgi:glycosyltransferase involved in cell wall biosynthesis
MPTRLPGGPLDIPEKLLRNIMGRRITFVLPNLSFSGGNKIVITYAEALADRGHDVTVVHGQLPSLKARIAAHFFPVSAHVHRPAANVRLIPARGPLAGIARFLPDADAVIATWWETVEAINGAPSSKGRKFHLVQDHEVFPYLPARSADVHRLPFHKIVVSNWLMDIMREVYGSTDVSLVMNPVDVDSFAQADRDRSERPTVGTVYSLTPRKNSAMAFEAVRLARKDVPTLQLSGFGADKLPNDLVREYVVNYHVRPKQHLIPHLYASCDLWLFTSESEGFGLPILEAMAVGTPVVGTSAGAAPELITDRTGRLVGLDATEMAGAIVDLLAEPVTKWRTMSRACRATAEAHDLESAVSKFEAIICA